MDFGRLILYRRGESPQPVRLRLGSLSIGSDPTADLVLDDSAVERFHLRLVCTPAGCQLTDLGSQGGTLVNRERIAAHTPRRLEDGDRIQVGRFGLLYQAPRPATQPEASAQPIVSTIPVPPAPIQPEVAAPPPDPDPVPEVVPVTSPTPPVVRPPAPPAKPAPPALHDEWEELFTAPITATPTPVGRMLPSNRRRAPRDLPYAAADYLALLPPLYHEDQFLQRFLLIFKNVLDPLDRMIGQIHYYFDPRLAPEPLVPWLASWVDLVLDERWPEARRRELIGAASALYRWRGTRRGLSDYLRIYTGVMPRIVEPGQERANEPRLAPHTFRVIIEVPDLSTLDRTLLERIITFEKPAHTSYELILRTTG